MTDPDRERRIAHLDARAHNTTIAFPPSDEHTQTTPNNPLQQRITRALEEADEHWCRMQDGVDYEALGAAVLAELQRELAALARVQALAVEYPVAIPTNLIDETLPEPTP
ncbi:hypothetical protein [Streptomyces sp. NPDC086519]|uniref:hypothetical protein n=1 Tax=Streptomyces sp. NPDC086519 TaxID=3154863 RepID=UPI00343DBFDA